MYFLDTHALLFFVLRSPEMSEKLFSFIDIACSEKKILASLACFWEIACLRRKNKISIERIEAWKDDLISYSGIQFVDLTADDMIRSVQLPRHHNDPFDRLFIAQAIQHQAKLITKDAVMQRYDVETLWK